jgi:peptidoglycan hydrolase CwlO-like protein
MKRLLAIAFCILLLCLVVFAQDKAAPSPASTITIPTVPSQDEANILRLQRDLAQLQGAISNLSAQFASCKTMVDQYTDQSSQASKGLAQAQEQVQNMTKQLDAEYKKLEKPGFTFDPKSLRYTPDLSAKPIVPAQPAPKKEGDKK